MRLLIFALMLCLVSTPAACTRVEYVASPSNFSMPKKPKSDFVCMNEPSVLGIETEEQDALYKNDLRRSWLDCFNKLMTAGEVWYATERELEKSKTSPRE